MDQATTKVLGFPVSWRTLVVVAVAVVAVGLAWGRIDVHQIHEYTHRLNGWLVFGLIAVLPLVGFPVTATHVLAGMRWGPAQGFAIAVLSILLQLLASYALVAVFRPLFERRLEPVRERLPRGAHGPVALFTVLLPGVPYFAKNYVLPLIGVPLRTFILWCFPIHALRSAVAVLFGDQSDNLTPGRIAAFAVYYTTVALTCMWAFRRVRAQVGDPRRGAGDPKPRG